MNGVIVIDKERGMTSFDVVAKIRKLAGTKKVGHTGTLDPDATGVLPVCIGNATRAADIMTGSDEKRYTALLRLGSATDTQDATGKVIARGDASAVTEEALAEALSRFTGAQKQIPPMYSAIKIGGKKLCDLARSGISVEREARPIEIRSLTVLSRDGADVTLDVSCSKGTYVRTLCHDIGEFLGCHAHMAALCRTQSGHFTLSDAVTLSRLCNGESLSEHLLPTERLFDYPVYTLTQKQEHLVRNGVPAYCTGDVGRYRVFSPSGEFLAISEICDIDGMRCLKLIRGFYTNGS